MPLSLNVRRLAIGFGRKSHDSEVRKDKTTHARPFFNFSWFSSSKSKEINRPPTPTPHALLKGSSDQSLKRPRSRRHLNPSQSSSSTEASLDVGNVEEFVGLANITEEEKAHLNSFARGLKEMMEQLRRAEETVDLPPTKTADGTPLQTIEEEDEPMSLVNSPLSSPRLSPSLHTGATLYTAQQQGPIPDINVQEDAQLESPTLAKTDNVLPIALDLPQRESSPVSRILEHAERDEKPIEETTLDCLVAGEDDLEYSSGDLSVSLLALSSDDEDLDASMSEDSVLGLQSILILPPTHDTDMPATPTPTFESSSYFAVSVHLPKPTDSLSKPLSRSQLQQLRQLPNSHSDTDTHNHRHPISMSLLPISLFARPRPLSTATDLDSLLEEEESGESESARDEERERQMEEIGEGENEVEGEAVTASPTKQIAAMRAKLGDIRKRLSELTEFTEAPVLPLAREEGEQNPKITLGRDGNVDELRSSLDRLTSEKNRLERAVADAELEKGRLKEQNALLLQTMDLTWEVTRQQLRDQDDQMEDLKSQIEGLQFALRELAEFNSAPVDPINPSVRTHGSGPNAYASAAPIQKHRLELEFARSPSNTLATLPAGELTPRRCAFGGYPEAQLTTPPATPSRGETALMLDSAIPLLTGLGMGVSGQLTLQQQQQQMSDETSATSSLPVRSGSWHGLVRQKGRRRHRGPAAVKTMFQDDDEENDVDDDAVFAEGRCQVKRRAGSMDLKSISSSLGGAIGAGVCLSNNSNPPRIRHLKRGL